ncbi:hypothetical protein DQ04_09131020, partial [Trypanosoma grayi]|uniref:hypothetical protein n=1 Tax=Trypanosoma grayi TaxID=71804 RepID=UPI0004F3FC90
MQELVAARGGQVENLPLLGAAVFAVGLLQDETDERFIVQLIDKRVGATVAEAPRGWQEFVQLDRLARGMGPKFDAPPLPEAQARRQYMCDYLNAAIAFGALSRVKELQEFVGYTEFVQQERRRAAG